MVTTTIGTRSGESLGNGMELNDNHENRANDEQKNVNLKMSNNYESRPGEVNVEE